MLENAVSGAFHWEVVHFSNSFGCEMAENCRFCSFHLRLRSVTFAEQVVELAYNFDRIRRTPNGLTDSQEVCTGID